METLKAQLIRHEALRLKPYHCTAGKLTIGVGRNLDDVGISRDEAMVLLDNDIVAATADCRRRLDPWFSALTEPRRNVLVNMCFNLGITRLLKFTNTLARVARGDYAGAAEAMLRSKWATQVGPRARELAEQMRTGRTRWAAQVGPPATDPAEQGQGGTHGKADLPG